MCVSHISVEAAETSVVVAHVALDLTEGQVHRTDFSGCMASTNRVSHSFEPETILHVHHAVPGTWKIMENHGKIMSLGKYMEIPIMNHSMSYSSEDVTFLDHLKGATVEHRG